MHGRMPEACIVALENPDSNAVSLEFFAKTMERGFAIDYDANRKYLTIDRKDLENQCNTEYGTDRRVKLENGLRSLLIFVDHSSVEIFVNHGEYVLSSRIFPNPDEHMIRMRGKDITLTIWKAKQTVEDSAVF